VSCYKELNTVEQGFRDLKDVIDMRPIYQKSDPRIETHIFVASLALFLKRTLEYQLSLKVPELSATDALAAVQSIGLAELDVGGETRRLVSGGGRDARRILAALRIKQSTGSLKTARMRVKNANVVTNPKSSSYLTRIYERN
jgi:hypothetical protein